MLYYSYYALVANHNYNPVCAELKLFETGQIFTDGRNVDAFFFVGNEICKPRQSFLSSVRQLCA